MRCSTGSRSSRRPSCRRRDDQAALVFIDIARKKTSLRIWTTIERANTSAFVTVDASNALFILTSNIGAARIPIGFRPEELAASSAAMREEVGKSFRPEFVNRLDEIIVFSPLSQQDAGRIVRLMLRSLEGRLAEQSIRLHVTDEAVLWLSQMGYDTSFGARAMRRAVAQLVEDPIAGGLLSGTIRPGQSLTVERNDSGLGFTVAR